MSGENKTIGELLKYVDSDFNSGLAHFKCGINNVLYTLIIGAASEVIVESDINGFLLCELIKKVYPAVEFKICDNSYIVFNIDDKYISVICQDDHLKFQIVSRKL